MQFRVKEKDKLRKVHMYMYVPNTLIAGDPYNMHRHTYTEKELLIIVLDVSIT